MFRSSTTDVNKEFTLLQRPLKHIEAANEKGSHDD